MSDLGGLIWCALIGLFRSRASLEAEILVLRHQLNVLRRKSPKRVALSNLDRLVLVGLYRLIPAVLDALMIVKPETVIRWHRAGFRELALVIGAPQVIRLAGKGKRCSLRASGRGRLPFSR
jgi:hypothetical protein